MRDAVKSYLTLAAGLTEVTRQRATAAARALVQQGEATAEQVGGLAEDLLTQSRQNREAVQALVGYEVDRTLGRIGLASNDEVAALLQRVRALEAEVRSLRAQVGGTAATAEDAGAAKAPARKAAAKKAPASKAAAAKAPASKAAARKTPATTAPGKTDDGGSSS